MFTGFFLGLKRIGIPVSITEYLALLDGLDRHVAGLDVDRFYYFARLALVKDERHFDRFDQVFGQYFRGADEVFRRVFGEVPDEWLRHEAELLLTDEEKQQIQALGGWDKLMEDLKQRLEEQRGRHQGGAKWIGTGGRSPYGAYGYNPEGIRIGQQGSRNRRAVKVWDRREFRNLDDTVELGTRNLKVAMRKLRRFARVGAHQELDLNGTISSTAKNAGLLDIKMVPERHNAVKVLLFFDVGGSMDDHVRIAEETFSAARGEFKNLHYFYFHNFVYEAVWKDNARRHTETFSTVELLRTFSPDYKVIFVGDATMSPYEISVAGGSVEHWNAEAGAVWMQRLTEHFPYLVWLNPSSVVHWDYYDSVKIVRRLIDDRMFPLTLEGLDGAIDALKRKN